MKKIKLKIKRKGTQEEYLKFIDQIIELENLLKKAKGYWKKWEFTDE